MTSLQWLEKLRYCIGIGLIDWVHIVCQKSFDKRKISWFQNIEGKWLGGIDSSINWFIILEMTCSGMFTQVCPISTILGHSSARATVTCSGSSGEFYWDGVGGDLPYQITCSDVGGSEFRVEINHQLESRTLITGEEYGDIVRNIQMIFLDHRSVYRYISYSHCCGLFGQKLTW